MVLRPSPHQQDGTCPIMYYSSLNQKRARKKSLQRGCFVYKQHDQPLFLSCTKPALTIQIFVEPWAATTLGCRALHQGQSGPAVVTSSSRLVTGSFGTAPAEDQNLPSTAGCKQAPGSYSDSKDTRMNQGRSSIPAVCS